MRSIDSCLALGAALALAGCSASPPLDAQAPRTAGATAGTSPSTTGGVPDVPDAPVNTWHTGSLSVLGSPGAASCLVLTTSRGKYQLISGDGHWVPQTGFRGTQVDPAKSGFQRGTGQTVIPGIVYPAGSRVRIFGHPGIEPGVVVRQHCPTDVVAHFLTDYRVTAAR